MARNLVKAGHEVKVFDLAPAAVKSLEEAGASSAPTAAGAAEGAEVVVTMLPSSPHVKDVYTGSGGVLNALDKGTLVLDCSTIDPNASRDVAAAAKDAGVRMVDAPVSGGVGAAEAGTLTFMVGGAEEDFTAASEVLKDMGANIVHCGGSGMGQVAKLCNNLILGISMSGIAEAYNLGVGLGIDPKVLASIVNTSSGRCWSSDTYNPVPGVMEGVPSSRDYEGGFGNTLMLKDLGLARDAAKAVGADLPMGTAAHATYTTLSNDDNYKFKDFGSVYKYLSEKRTGGK